MTDLLQLAAAGDARGVMRDMRVRALFSPYYFVKAVLGYSKLTAGFHQLEMDSFVERWARGETKQAVEWPRGFYKTTCFTIGTGIWVVLPVRDEDTEYALETLGIAAPTWYARVALHDQDATQLYAFEIIDNASKKIRGVRWHFEENELFRTLFPEIAWRGDERPWNDECLRTRRVGARQRDAEGTFEAIGVGGALQSRHYKIVWEDDLVGERARKSQTVMEDTIGWHGRLHGAFENATSQIRFLVSNRWGYADLNSYVRENEPDFVFHTRSAIEFDETSGQDAPTFPEQYPLDKIAQIRDSGSMSSYDFSCQYMNSPVLPGEKAVDTSLLHYYTVESDGRIRCSCGATFFASALNRYLHYDPYNAKGAGSVSCPALVVIGASSDKHILVLDYFLAKQTYNKIYDRIFWFNDTWRPVLMTYEDVGHQNMTAFHWQEVAKTQEYRAKHRRAPRIEGVTTGNRSKESRIRESLFPVIENGKFAVRKTHAILLQMLDTFPHKRLDHDYDLLDAISQGAAQWRWPEAQDERDRGQGEEDEYLKRFNAPFSHAGKLVPAA